MSERISLAAVMVLTRFGRIKAAFIPCLLQCKGLVLASKSCSLLPKHPHPKMWGKSHLHAGYSPFNGKHLLVLLLESFAPSIRSLRGRQQPEGCQGNSPRGERCRLCQVSRDWHREHTWSGSTCPGQGRAVPSASAEPGTGAIRASSPRVSSGRATSRGYRAQITAGFTLQVLLPEASKGFGPCSLGSCCTALGRAEQQLLCQASSATHWCHFLGTNVPSLDRNRS